MAGSAFTLYAINYNKEVDVLLDGVQSQNLSPNITDVLLGGDGEIYNRFQAGAQISPALTWITSKLNQLDTIGLAGL
ncbi:unnamed protein product, partial [marine sediment metagenome]